MRRLPILLYLCCALLPAVPGLRAREDQPAPPPGKMEDGAEFLKTLAPLAIDGGRLRVARSAQPTPDELGACLNKAVFQVGGRQPFTAKREQPGELYLYDSLYARGELTLDAAKGTYDLLLSEKDDARRMVQVEIRPGAQSTIGVYLRTAKKQAVLLTEADGTVRLCIQDGSEVSTLRGSNFEDLLRKHPVPTQVKFLRPLADLGVDVAWHRLLPVVVATATSGYNLPPAALQHKVDAQIARLADDDVDTRDAATKELIKLYPLAIYAIDGAIERATDAEVRHRLKTAAAAHPNIQKAKAWVAGQKLQDDRNYLLEILKTNAFFKPAARERLARLWGTDFGEDPKFWPEILADPVELPPAK